MASADLEAELECSVCLSVYTDPVILKCGHNFCQQCINCVLDVQEGCGDYSCPECRQRFHERPALQRNMKLRNIVETFLSAQSDQEKSKVFCSIHRKILEYYCSEDNTCACVSCCLIGEHQGHKMESLEEASEKKKKKIKNVLQKLLTKSEKAEERVQNLQKRMRKADEKAASDTEKVTFLFRDLRRKLKVLEERVLGELSGQAKLVSLSMLDLIKDLEIKKEALAKKMQLIEELCATTNPLTVLQESDTGGLYYTEDGDNEDRHRYDDLLCDARHLTMAEVSNTLQSGLSDVMSGVNLKIDIGKYLYPHFATEDNSDIIVVPYLDVPRAASTIQDKHHHPGRPGIQSVLKILGLSKGTDLILDVNTAGNDLCISNNRKTVSRSIFTHKCPEIPERFQSAQVLSTQSFSSGRHHWEVDVSGSQVWSVGMCYPSINRTGCHSEIGWNNKSWGLHKSWLNNQYSVLYDRKWIPLHGKISINKVSIYLDYEAGQISFYDLSDPIRHLYTFNATFTEPLHVVLWVGGGIVKILRGNEDMEEI